LKSKNLKLAVVVALFCMCSCNSFANGEKFKSLSGLPSSYDESVPQKDRFFFILSRLPEIKRWAVLRSLETEDVQQHSFDTAITAHALVMIQNTYYGGDLSADRAAVLALFHDVAEIVTGDCPSPVKHANSQMKESYSQIEGKIADDLLTYLPKEMQVKYLKILKQQKEEAELWNIVKAADVISGIKKCLHEKHLGNTDFDKALAELTERVMDFDIPAVKYFIQNFLPAFGFECPEDLAPPIVLEPEAEMTFQ
jgi:5'-deoxynucleotidase